MPTALAPQAELRALGGLGLRQQPAGRRILAGEADARGLPDGAASAVASDEVGRPHRPAVGQFDVHTGVVLGEPVTSSLVIGTPSSVTQAASVFS